MQKSLFEETLYQICMKSRILDSQQFIQHGATTVLEHSIAVAYFSYKMTQVFNIKVDERKLICGALLHDYFLYDWHVKDPTHRWHGFRHPYFALANATKDMELSELEQDIIKKHMFPLTPIPPKYRESVIVSLVDKLCSIYEIFYLELFFAFYGKHLANIMIEVKKGN